LVLVVVQPLALEPRLGPGLWVLPELELELEEQQQLEQQPARAREQERELEVILVNLELLVRPPLSSSAFRPAREPTQRISTLLALAGPPQPPGAFLLVLTIHEVAVLRHAEALPADERRPPIVRTD
jgi:hypothetical protein